ncbi:tRNA uridine-5-carboxymethylaminomethyl(34) synthesis GTPase MnmE [Mycoplasmopsis felis]|uniref:tRNA uridine-5-carboxymethylaminomethyl(34) synthesis GTPase MnmE n=1 Tax=Mycoplasmopsis felis TaxID=33923 RepID=UPI002B000445|nr:tRNA uridine-5-carboxymethylaminomethyl(34) synthesis GTPase MnmE [Mycoplasmopsis felis]WQQ09968.1 tRNA uridine-5-carboxymethylaminomethyl(34) synthesis GTPase MnmE [Mycoplasmopsis felis]
MFDTIAAISSGSRMNQPISIVRLSGPEALNIIKKIYKGKIGSDHEITYGHIYDQDSLVDEVLIMWFLGKKSNETIIYNNYVGEPLIEINCHGGIITTNYILELLLSNGARLAEKGEFTRRAYLNGKMDLVKAQAIHDLIFSKTILQAKGNVNKFKGKTSNLIDTFLNKIAMLIGICEVNIDYPEYDDVQKMNNTSMINSIDDLINELENIVKVSQDSRYLFEGVNVAILGKPNVGKSSILNALLSEDKAIVTDIAGTTRDLVEASYQINGILFKLVDTAGLRKTDEKIEQIGIEKSIEQIKKSDLVLHIIDPTQKEDEFDELIYKQSQLNEKIYIKVQNKSDLIDNINCNNCITISALKNDIKNLEEALIEKFQNIDILDERIFSNTQQLSHIKSALVSLQEAKKSLSKSQTFDVVIIDLYNSWDSLQNIKGNVNREDLLDIMFSNFCLGK